MPLVGVGARSIRLPLARSRGCGLDFDAIYAVLSARHMKHEGGRTGSCGCRVWESEPCNVERQRALRYSMEQLYQCRYEVELVPRILGLPSIGSCHGNVEVDGL